MGEPFLPSVGVGVIPEGELVVTSAFGVYRAVVSC